jgi:hypothetical protein
MLGECALAVVVLTLDAQQSLQAIPSGVGFSPLSTCTRRVRR